MGCVVLRHLAQKALRGRIIGRVNTVKVGNKERRFVGPELCKYSPGLSGKLILGLVNVGRGSIE